MAQVYKQILNANKKMNLTKDKIKPLLNKPLPGLAAHLKMAPPTRKAELEATKEVVPFAKKSAVMILLFHENFSPVLWIFRNNHDTIKDANTQEVLGAERWILQSTR